MGGNAHYGPTFHHATPRLYRARFRRAAVSANFHLFASVSGLKLMTNGQDEDDVFGWKPSILRDVSVTTSRENEFAPPLISGSPQQRMIR